MSDYRYKILDSLIEDVNTDNSFDVSLIYTYQMYQNINEKFDKIIDSYKKLKLNPSNFNSHPSSIDYKWVDETLLYLNNIKSYYISYKLVNEKKELTPRAKVRVIVNKHLVKKVSNIIKQPKVWYHI